MSKIKPETFLGTSIMQHSPNGKEERVMFLAQYCESELVERVISPETFETISENPFVVPKGFSNFHAFRLENKNAYFGFVED